MTTSEVEVAALPRTAGRMTALRPPAEPRGDRPLRPTEVYGRALLSRLAVPGRARPRSGGCATRPTRARARRRAGPLARPLRSGRPQRARPLPRPDPGRGLRARPAGRRAGRGRGPGARHRRQRRGRGAHPTTRRARRWPPTCSARSRARAGGPPCCSLDGNVGIGGDPARLVRRCAALLAAGGHLLVELDGPGRTSGTVRLRLELPAPAGGGTRPAPGSRGPGCRWTTSRASPPGPGSGSTRSGRRRSGGSRTWCGDPTSATRTPGTAGSRPPFCSG